MVAIAVASAATQTLGELSHRYFAGACSMSAERLGACFDATYKKQYTRKRDEVRAIWRTPEVRRQFVELLKARREGGLSEGETQQRMHDLLTGTHRE